MGVRCSNYLALVPDGPRQDNSALFQEAKFLAAVIAAPRLNSKPINEAYAREVRLRFTLNNDGRQPLTCTLCTRLANASGH